MFRIVQNPYRGSDGFGLIEIGATGLQISFSIRKVATRELNSDAVAWTEKIAGHNALQRYPVDLTSVHQAGPIKTTAVSQAQHGIPEVKRFAIRVYVHQFQSQIAVRGRG